MDADLLLRGATVIDGTGSEPFVADVAVRRDQIVAVGDLSAMRASQELDFVGHVLCPGFIDIHTHSDVSLLLDPRCQSKVAQGVTTEVTGNCSLSPFPLANERLDLHVDHLAMIANDVPLTWRDLDGYAERVAENPPAMNVAPLVGHGAVRVAVMGVDERPPTDDEMIQMRRLVAESLDQGAFGMSTGLTLVPSSYGDYEEVRELVGVVAEQDALYATHSRALVRPGFFHVEEAISTAKEAGARLQFSHAGINEPSKWGRADHVVELFEEAENQGLDVGFDVYPYDASSSPLTQYLPQWVQAGGNTSMRDRLSSPAERKRALRELSAGWFGGIPWHWDRVVISRSGRHHDWCIGMSIEEAAAQADMEPAAFMLELCLSYGSAVDAVLFYRTEEDVLTFLTHRLSVVGSDGSAIPFEQRDLKPHPRSFGTYPRVLGRYVRDQEALSLAEAVHKMTGAVAERLQLKDRGLVRDGVAADLVVFDPTTVIDHATFIDPNRRPVGISHVIVNGMFVIHDGEQTAARPGRLLRRGD